VYKEPGEQMLPFLFVFDLLGGSMSMKSRIALRDDSLPLIDPHCKVASVCAAVCSRDPVDELSYGRFILKL
jgi:hypothetical protein